MNRRQFKSRQFGSTKCDADDDNVGGGDAATTTGSRTAEDFWPDDRFDPRRIVGVNPMMT